MLGLLPTTPIPIGGWDALLSALESRPGLSEIERAEAKTAILFFRAAFGEDWKGLVEGFPFASTLLTSAQGGPIEAVRVYRLLQALGSNTETEQLLVDLRGKNWEHYASADMVLRIAAHFRACGLELEIPRHLNRKVADIRVTAGRRTVTIECSALREPKARQAFDDFFQKLMDWTNEDIERRGRLRLHFLGEFDPSVLQRLWSTMSAVWQRVKALRWRSQARCALSTSRMRRRSSSQSRRGLRSCLRMPLGSRPSSSARPRSST